MRDDTGRSGIQLKESALVLARRLAALSRLLAEPPGVYGAIGMLLVVLFAVTTVVAARFEHARASRAESLFNEGRQAVADNRVGEGLISLRAALALDRRNPDYGLALASALLTAGRSREASSYLDRVLAERPTGGPANLTRARAVRMLGDVDQATLYYRRAADGTWPPGSAAQRVGVRFEMAEYLIGRSRLADAGVALSELRVSAPDDPATRVRLARLLLMARMPTDAADELRALTATRAGDADVWSLLARAEFDRGSDAGARSAGRRALQLHPDDAATAGIVAISTGVLALDPSLPRLRNSERIRRARQLLTDALDASGACVVGRESVPDVVMASRDRAREFLRTRTPRDVDPVEDAIQLAEGLWSATIAICSDTEGRYPILDRIFTRLTAARPEGS